MHNCAYCGQGCDCSGDIDDISCMTEEWIVENCECECENIFEVLAEEEELFDELWCGKD